MYMCVYMYECIKKLIHDIYKICVNYQYYIIYESKINSNLTNSPTCINLLKCISNIILK